MTETTRPRPRGWLWWAAAAAFVLTGAIAFVEATGMRPSYDPFGWMVWGYQILHGSLDTNGAPSWKPLTFLFTLPYAVFGSGQVWLWSVTSVAGTLAAGVLAGRLAYRLTGPVRRSRRFAPYAASAFAGVAVMGIQTWPHLVLIANSDQLNTALLLGAIDAHLHRHRRPAFALLCVASLGRPEVWAYVLLYGAWLAYADPPVRSWVAIALALVAALWFVIPALTSRNWLSAGDLALNQHTAIPGSKIIGVVRRWRNLYELPMQLAALLGVGLAGARRDRDLLGIAAAALLWVIIEIGFAYHGWSAASRYLIEPAAVGVVIAGALVGQLLGGAPWATGELTGRALRWGGPIAVVALAVSLVPAARLRVHDWRLDLPLAHAYGRESRRLSQLVSSVGGRGAILACGKPTTLIGSQSAVAWAVGLNVGDVGFHIGKAIDRGIPIVAFTPHDYGWRLRVYNQPSADASRCARLRTDTATG